MMLLFWIGFFQKKGFALKYGPIFFPEFIYNFTVELSTQAEEYSDISDMYGSPSSRLTSDSEAHTALCSAQTIIKSYERISDIIR